MTSYALLGGVSRARSTAREISRERSIPTVVGCAPPNTRRAMRSESSSIVTASRRSSSVAPSSSHQNRRLLSASMFATVEGLVNADIYFEDSLAPFGDVVRVRAEPLRQRCTKPRELIARYGHAACGFKWMLSGYQV